MRANRELVLAHLNGICHRVMKYPRLWHYHHKSRHLTNDDFTIICNNCTGGVILHDLEQRFNTPTVNLSLSVSDFIEFVSDLRGYFLADVQEEHRLNAAYPIGRIGHGDKVILLNFVHYKTFEEGRAKWNERKARVFWDNIFILVESPEISEHDMERLSLLEYPVAVLGPENDDFEQRYNFYHGFKYYRGWYAGKALDYKSRLGLTKFLDDFDYISFLNRE